ncbi:MAG TPA: PQQ-binding-like beta-propeller repeat protein [Vicinamibacterales bacterium]|nr:PQQ-binding-like beta-propeller repeat protein [Vicinamibacterales bacterium]
MSRAFAGNCIVRVVFATLGCLLGSPVLSLAQSPDGAKVFADRCASCHSGAADSRAPALETLRARTPAAIIEALVNGAMRPQGSRMSGAERRAVAEFAAGRPMAGDVAGSSTGRCAAVAPLSSNAGSAWSGWSPSPTNTRFQPRGEAGLTAPDIRRLTLKWAFGFPDASSAWSQPTMVGGRVFVGSQNGTVYSLDAKTGCIHWTFAAGGGVRTAVTVVPTTGGQLTAYFGDTAANVYALDAGSGKPLWVRKVDDHPLARVTGSPVVHQNRVFAPVSSYEESQGADPQYGCCTFRGSLVALDAASGTVVWKTYMIPDPPKPRGTSSAGVPLWGPAGSAIWSAPAIDVKRGALYVATGNAYSGPAHASSNAVVALDLDSGRIRWQRQFTPNDVYLTGCRPGNANCPETNGPDFDFGSPPILATDGRGRDLIVIGQKSGVAHAIDPEKSGEIVWQYRAGRGGVLGGIEWGSAADDARAYFAVSDITLPQPGGLHAVLLATGERAWLTPPPPAKCGSGRGCNAAQSAAITAIEGAVFSGSNDGVLRAYASADGLVLWEFDTNREFQTVNGVPARGASMIGPGPAIAGGMLFVGSGYGAFGGRAGNVLLAFGFD